MSKVGITSKKIAHYITPNSANGLGGYWDAVCGKWICPKALLEDDTLPEDARMCKQCAAKGPAIPKDAVDNSK